MEVIIGLDLHGGLRKPKFPWGKGPYIREPRGWDQSGPSTFWGPNTRRLSGPQKMRGPNPRRLSGPQKMPPNLGAGATMAPEIRGRGHLKASGAISEPNLALFGPISMARALINPQINVAGVGFLSSRPS